MKDNSKIQVFDDTISKLYQFKVCRFKYKINPKTFHYIMWYNCAKDDLTSEEITNDIKKSIYIILKSDDFKFIWYENPKMSIEDIYHVQVFWVRY